MLESWVIHNWRNREVKRDNIGRMHRANVTQLVSSKNRVAQKNGATLSHCKYSENSMTE